MSRGPHAYPALNEPLERHPQRDEILKALLENRMTVTAISRKYKIDDNALHRYLRKGFAELMLQEQKRRAANTVDGILSAIAEEMGGLKKLREACEREMQDPDDPTRFTTALNAMDVEVTFIDPADPSGKTRRKAQLSEIIKGQAWLKPFSISWRREDTRKLYVDISRAVDVHLEHLSKVLGLMKEVRINITRHEGVLIVVGELMDLLAKAAEKGETAEQARGAIEAFWEQKSKEETA